ncbi:hypothetical protein [Thalassotalea montiporae]
MKKLIGLVAFTAVTLSTQTSAANIQFVGKDKSTETNLCMLAAEQGYNAVAAKFAQNKRQLHNTKCNGETLKDFAASFKASANKVEHKTVIVSGNQSMESQLCMKAVKEGVRAVGHRVSSLKCNGQSVASFVKAVKRS